MESEIAEIFVDLKEVSKPYFDITDRRYRQLAEDGVVPSPMKGKIPLLGAFKALLAYKTKLAEGQGSLGLTEERTLKVQVERKLKELEYLVETKELIRREEVLGEFMARINIVKQTLWTLHRVLPPQLIGKDARQISDILKKTEYDLLERFSRKSGVLRYAKHKKGMVGRGVRALEAT